MRTHRLNLLHASRLRPLAACLAMAFSAVSFAGQAVGDPAFAPMRPAAAMPSAAAKPWADALQSAFGKSVGATPDHPTTVLTVLNCNDAGSDSLREAVGAAPDGATIQFDMTQMQCSKITLTSGQIDVTQDKLTLQGPGADLLMIDGDYSGEHHYNRIFNHSGQGALTIQALTLSDAKYFANAAQNANGGCIFSNGTVDLVQSKVEQCRLMATGTQSKGGAVYARYVGLLASTVSDSHVGSDTDSAAGGGIFVSGGSFVAKYSNIENNVAHSYSQNFTGNGGGIAVGAAPTLIRFSTISGNHAERAGGLLTFSSGATATISDSTFSENSAESYGGLYIRQNNAYFYNATIAFNTASALGQTATAGVGAGSLQSNSSIFAYNTTDDGSGAVERDVESDDGMVTGAHNLIIAANANTTVPGDTSPACPRLAPLLDNGGSTRTHALLPDSPAIDAPGNNVQNLVVDQRGTGFPRTVGLDVDIGAYEFTAGSGDVINMSGFEGCN